MFGLFLKLEAVFVSKYHFVFTFPSPVFPPFLACSAVLHSILLPPGLSKLFHAVAVHYRNTNCVSYSSKVRTVAFQKTGNEPGLQRDVPVPPLMFRGLSGVEEVGHLGTCILKWFSKHSNAAGGKEIKTKAD